MKNYQKKIMLLVGVTVLVLGSVFLFQNTYASNASPAVTLDKTVVVDGATAVVLANSFGTATAHCPNKDVATGGGFSSGFVGTPVQTNTIQASIPTPTTTGSIPNGWEIEAVNNSPNNIALAAYVVCQAPAS